VDTGTAANSSACGLLVGSEAAFTVAITTRVFTSHYHGPNTHTKTCGPSLAVSQIGMRMMMMIMMTMRAETMKRRKKK
jgi:hypothetical protein